MKQQRNIQDYQLLCLAEQKAEGRQWSLLTSEEVSDKLSLSKLQTARLLYRLKSQNRILQLQRGLYLLPGKLPPGKLWMPSPYEALWAYMNWLGAKWQITGTAAFLKYGFTTQIPQTISIYNDKISDTLETSSWKFVFIKINQTKIGNIQFFSMSGGIEIPYSSKARTIFDALYDGSRFNTAIESINWLISIKDNKNDIQEFINCCLIYGDKQTICRSGFILEKLGFDVSRILKYLEPMKNSTMISLVPGSRKGKIEKKWSTIENFHFTNLD